MRRGNTSGAMRPGHSILNLLVSFVWSQLNGMVRKLVRAGAIKPVRLNVPVISIGNIQAGGGGKTPLVAALATEAHDRGLKVCILIRGYKARWEKTGGVILPASESVNPSVHPRDCGDEAALLHYLCPFAWIGVGANRVQQYRAVQKQMQGSPHLVILDDGFQNWQMHKDKEIVAWTSTQPWRIPFRDTVEALEHANLVVWTKGSKAPHEITQLPAHIPVIRVKYQLEMVGDKEHGPEKCHGPLHELEPLWMITGIADGHSAYQLALDAGYPIVRYTFLRDHKAYKLKEVKSFIAEAVAKKWKLLVTGKDWVKWKELGVDRSQIRIMEPQLLWVSGREHWLRVIWGE